MLRRSEFLYLVAIIELRPLLSCHYRIETLIIVISMIFFRRDKMMTHVRCFYRFQKIATDFLESRLSADDFLSQFVDKRRESQLKRVNAEKVVDLLREQRRMSNIPSAMPLYPGQGGMMAPLGPPMTYHPPSMPPMGYGVPPYPMPYPAYPPAGPMSMPTPGT